MPGLRGWNCSYFVINHVYISPTGEVCRLSALRLPVCERQPGLEGAHAASTPDRARPPGGADALRRLRLHDDIAQGPETTREVPQERARVEVILRTVLLRDGLSESVETTPSDTHTREAVLV